MESQDEVIIVDSESEVLQSESRPEAPRGNSVIGIEAQRRINLQIADELCHEASNLASKANQSALLLKTVFVVGTIFTICSGAVIGTLNLYNYSSVETRYSASILGFLVAVTGTALAIFSVEKKSALSKEAWARIRTIIRDVRALQHDRYRPDQIRRKLQRYYTILDEYDSYLFDSAIHRRAHNSDRSQSGPAAEYSTQFKSHGLRAANIELPNV